MVLGGDGLALARPSLADEPRAAAAERSAPLAMLALLLEEEIVYLESLAPPNPGDERRTLLAEATRRLAESPPDLDTARELLDRADSVPLFEAPNRGYAHFLALLACARGEPMEAEALLAEFQCVLAVDQGRLPCAVGRAGPPARDGRPLLTPRCRARMCSEIHLSYYLEPYAPPGARERFAQLERQLAEARRACGMAAEGAPSETQRAPCRTVERNDPILPSGESLELRATFDCAGRLESLHSTTFGERGQSEIVLEPTGHTAWSGSRTILVYAVSAWDRWPPSILERRTDRFEIRDSVLRIVGTDASTPRDPRGLLVEIRQALALAETPRALAELRLEGESRR